MWISKSGRPALGAALMFCTAAGAWGQVQEEEQTSAAVTSVGGFRAVALDREAAAAHGRQGSVVLEGFPLSEGGLAALELERFEIFTADARIVEQGSAGARELPRPEAALFRGVVRGDVDSRVFLSLSEFGVYGAVRHGGKAWIVSSGPPGEWRPTLVYEPLRVADRGIRFAGFQCGTDAGFELAVPGGGVAEDGDPPCRVAEIAVETDWEFTARFGGNTAASSAYAAALLGAVSEIYAEDLNAHLVISYLRVWSDNGDLWTENDAILQLYQFQDYWNGNMTGVQRNAAHFLSGRALQSAGGVAYLPGLCQSGYDYGLSAHLNGFFPYPLEDNNPQNWDVVVVAHELGHNFGAPHTHSVGIDQCGNGDCSGASAGTIMSYCHGCPGGLANIALTLHPVIINNYILPYLGSGLPCDLVVDDTPIVLNAQPAGQTVWASTPVVFHVGASGPGELTYQWRRDGQGLSDGGRVSGSHTATLTIVSAQPNDAAVYDVVVGNNCTSTVSEPASLAVNWCGALEAQLSASDGVDNDRFGHSMASSADRALSGAPLNDEGGFSAGAVYVHERQGDEWVGVQKLQPADRAANQRFGQSLAMSGATAVIGASKDSQVDSEAGAAYVFERGATGWFEAAKLTAADGTSGDEFGIAVGLDGDTAAVGAWLDADGGFNAGSAYVFVRLSGVWTMQAKLVSADLAAGDLFGNAVSISGDTLAVGARGDDGPGSNAGAVYVFTRTGSAWVQSAKLKPADGQSGDEFGHAVVLQGARLLVGARRSDSPVVDAGAAYVFERSGGVWTQTAKLTPPGARVGDEFGFAVGLDGDRAAVGARLDDEAGADSGAVYAYRRSGGTWVLEVKLFGGGLSGGDEFGYSVALTGARVMGGARLGDGGVTNSGSARAYDLSAAAPAFVVQPQSQASCAGAAVSLSVAVTSDYSPVSYQWRRGDVNLVDGGNVSGATTAQLTLNPVSPADAADDYHCVVSNACGPSVSEFAAVAVMVSGSGDGNGDGTVDGDDLAGFVAALLDPPQPGACAYDMDQSGQVTAPDAGAFAAELLSP